MRPSCFYKIINCLIIHNVRYFPSNSMPAYNAVLYVTINNSHGH